MEEEGTGRTAGRWSARKVELGDTFSHSWRSPEPAPSESSATCMWTCLRPRQRVSSSFYPTYAQMLTGQHPVHAVLAGLSHRHTRVERWDKVSWWADTINNAYSLSQTLPSSRSLTIHSPTVKLGDSVGTECPGLEVQSEVMVRWREKWVRD